MDDSLAGCRDPGALDGDENGVDLDAEGVEGGLDLGVGEGGVEGVGDGGVGDVTRLGAVGRDRAAGLDIDVATVLDDEFVGTVAVYLGLVLTHGLLRGGMK